MKLEIKLDKRNRITIPKEAVKKLGLEMGDTLELDVNGNGTLYISKKEEK